MEFTTIKIGGMSCGGCVKSITGLLLALPGVTTADISLAEGKADVSFEPEQVSRATLVDAIENAGFEAE